MLTMFAVIKDKGTMHNVTAHFPVLEARANAGPAPWRASCTTPMTACFASGVTPNAYKLAVLVVGAAVKREYRRSNKPSMAWGSQADNFDICTRLELHLVSIGLTGTV
ncbi:hypothetical protein C2845_PM05G20480 [Panicum miliaceum]|uniref:Uncharacterized protein n=1 Tax=Panicum miliaceum TaxID=4540 RepID=A0A3L6SXH2_PANMI|nr:hypothetical protein C2845_PM05G20480 [Panicum miliaceum]